MSVTQGVDLTKPRPLPDVAYCVPDGRNLRLATVGWLLDEISFYAVGGAQGEEVNRLRVIAGFARIAKKITNLGEEFSI